MQLVYKENVVKSASRIQSLVYLWVYSHVLAPAMIQQCSASKGRKEEDTVVAKGPSNKDMKKTS